MGVTSWLSTKQMHRGKGSSIKLCRKTLHPSGWWQQRTSQRIISVSTSLCVYQSLCLPVSVSTNLCLPVSVSTSLCVYQDEVQSAHWGDRQITIHPVVLHYRCHCLQNVTEYMIFLTDDMQKEGNMVKAIPDRVLEHTKQKGLKRMVTFSDGCGAQYKSRLLFYHLLQLQSTSMTVEKASFSSNHGKSLCDASGGVIKIMAKQAVVSGRTIIHNASDLFAFCVANLVLPSADGPNRSCVHTMRSFVKLDSCDIDRVTTSSQMKTVKGCDIDRGTTSSQMKTVKGCDIGAQHQAR